MRLNTLSLSAAALAAASGAAPAPVAKAQPPSALEHVAAFDHRPTGVAVADDGRVIVSLPFSSYSDPQRFTMSLAAVAADGTATPYPNAAWNRRPSDHPNADPQTLFLNLQSHTIDRADRLWVLDRGRPQGRAAVPGGAKLVQIDLKRDRVVRIIAFEAPFADGNFLNDVRVDPDRELAFVTDTANGGVIVVDLKTGAQRWGLRGGDWMAFEARPPTVQGVTVAENRRRSVPQGPDGLALSPDGEWLYLKAHPWVAPTLYRVRVAVLADPSLGPRDVEARIEHVANTVYSDGIEIDQAGRVYFTDVEAEAVTRLDPAAPSADLERLVRDPRLSWPDAIGFGPYGNLYVSAAQFHRLPVANAGVDRSERPLGVFRLAVEHLD
ncbi:MAG: L-dopachrome tautomerase-related protein [Pseudomonadota bacterium]